MPRTAAGKARLALQTVRGRQPLATIAAKHGVAAADLRAWRDQLLLHAATLFTDDGARARVFISHSHQNKAFAARVARRLRLHGLTVWIDDRTIQPGEPLPAYLRQQIRRSTHVVVIASRAAAISRWVCDELAHARGLAPPRRVIPLFVEGVESMPLFEGDMGMNVRRVSVFGPQMLSLASYLLGHAPQAPSRQALEEAVADLTHRSQHLQTRIEWLNGTGGFPEFDIRNLAQDDALDVSDLDDALWLAYQMADHERREAVAACASVLFARQAVGVGVLREHVEAGGGLCRLDVRSPDLPVESLDIIVELLEHHAPTLERDLWLERIVIAQFERLPETLRQRLVRLAVHPIRGPQIDCAAAVFELTQRMPDHLDLISRWQWWIREGSFDGRPGCDEDATPEILADHLRRAGGGSAQPWCFIAESLADHVRDLVATCTDDELDWRAVAACRHLLEALRLELAYADPLRTACAKGLRDRNTQGRLGYSELSNLIDAATWAGEQHRDYEDALKWFEQTHGRQPRWLPFSPPSGNRRA